MAVFSGFVRFSVFQDDPHVSFVRVCSLVLCGELCGRTIPCAIVAAWVCIKTTHNMCFSALGQIWHKGIFHLFCSRAWCMQWDLGLDRARVE